MDVEMLIEALTASSPDEYFALREHFPQDLIGAEVALLTSKQKLRYNELEQLWRSSQKPTRTMPQTGDGEPPLSCYKVGQQVWCWSKENESDQPQWLEATVTAVIDSGEFICIWVRFENGKVAQVSLPSQLAPR